MAGNVEVRGKISVDTGDTAKKVGDLKDQIKQLKEGLDKTTVGSKEHTAALSQLSKVQEDLKKATDASTSSHAKSGEAFGLLKEKVGSMVPAFKGVEGGASSFNGALKTLSANPVVLTLLALVGVLKTVYEYFKNTFEGGQKLEQVFAGIQAAGQALLDNLNKIGSAIKNVFTFNFRGAVKDIEEVGSAAKKAYDQMAELTKQSQQLKKEQRQNDLEAAQRDRDLAVLREKAYDSETPITERIRLLKDLKAQSEQNYKDDIDLAKRTADNKIAQLTLQKDGEKKNADEINKIRIEQIKGETENAGELRRIAKALTSAEKEVEAERKKIADDEKARRKESAEKVKEYADKQKKILEEQIKLEKALAEAKRKSAIDEIKQQEEFGEQLRKEQQRLDDLETKRQLDNERTRLTNKKKLAELDLLNNPDNPARKVAKIKADLELELSTIAEGDLQRQILSKKASDAIVKITEEEEAQKKALTDAANEDRKAQFSEVGSRLTQLTQIIGEQTGIGKGIATAQATINTWQGVTETLREKSVLPQPFATISRLINAGAVLASGIRAVQKINSTPVPGGGGGGGSVPSATAITPPVNPQNSVTSLDQDSINKVGNAAAGGINRSFVLDSDITDSSERAARINRQARLV